MEYKSTIPFHWKILSILWVSWVFIDFLLKHPLYVKSFNELFWTIPLVHCIIGGAAYLLISRYAKRQMTPLLILGVFMAMLWSGTLWNLILSDVDTTFSRVLFYLGRTIGIVVYVCLFILAAKRLGSLLVNALIRSDITLSPAVHISLGLCLYMFVYLMLLYIGLFDRWVIWILTALPLLISPKYVQRVISGLHKPLPGLESMSNWSLAGLIAILLVDAITFSLLLAPMPLGYDALNYYINLPKLIYQSGELLPGFQPYNWSLLQAAGAEAFHRIDLALVFSWVALPLLQWSGIEFGRRVLKMSLLQAILAMLVFSCMLSVMTQASLELKIDLGLTFILLTMLDVGLYIAQSVKHQTESKLTQLTLGILVGMLMGFALGIKLTSIVALMGIVALLWFAYVGEIGLLSCFLISIAVVFIARMDDLSGTRYYHASVAWLQYATLAIGGIGLIWAIVRHRSQATRALLLSVVMIAVSLVCFSPWLVKNYIEADKKTMINVLKGYAPGPDINLKLVKQKMKELGEE